MVNASGDPVIEAAHIWSDTLTVLKHSASLSPREKAGWKALFLKASSVRPSCCVWTTTTRFKPFRVI